MLVMSGDIKKKLRIEYARRYNREEYERIKPPKPDHKVLKNGVPKAEPFKPSRP